MVLVRAECAQPAAVAKFWSLSAFAMEFIRLSFKVVAYIRTASVARVEVTEMIVFCSRLTFYVSFLYFLLLETQNVFNQRYLT